MNQLYLITPLLSLIFLTTQLAPLSWGALYPEELVVTLLRYMFRPNQMFISTRMVLLELTISGMFVESCLKLVTNYS